MLCANRKEPLGLPLQSIPLFFSPDGSGAHFPRDDFGDSPRDYLLANLDGEGRCDFGIREPFWDSSNAQPLPQLLSAHSGRGREGSKGGKQQCLEEEATAADPTGTAEHETSRVKAALRDWPEHVTTVMLRNIPNRYTAEELLAEMLAEGFKGTFDFFYLPIDFITKRNRGYCFINFHEPADSRKFVVAFHRQQLTRYSTQKILQVSPAMTQGLSANVAHFVKKDAQRIQNPWFRPMIFSNEGEDVAMAQAARQAKSDNPCQEGSTEGPTQPPEEPTEGPTAAGASAHLDAEGPTAHPEARVAAHDLQSSRVLQ